MQNILPTTDNEFEYRTRILASSDLPSTPKHPKANTGAGPLIYIIVGSQGRQHCCSLLTLSTCRRHVADMLWVCRHGADGVASKRAATTHMSPTCRPDMSPTCRRRVADVSPCRHFRTFLPTRHSRHILLRPIATERMQTAEH